jgi:hypothetical protein
MVEPRAAWQIAVCDVRGALETPIQERGRATRESRPLGVIDEWRDLLPRKRHEPYC